MIVSPEIFRRLCRARDLLAFGGAGDASLSIRAVAAEIQISHFHFIRRFEALFGMTPHQWRIRMRIDRAKQLLAEGRLSVTEVCMGLGFSSLGSFSDSFARRVGAPPSIYRERARVLVSVPVSLAIPGCFGLLTRAHVGAFRNFREA